MAAFYVLGTIGTSRNEFGGYSPESRDVWAEICAGKMTVQSTTLNFAEAPSPTASPNKADGGLMAGPIYGQAALWRSAPTSLYESNHHSGATPVYLHRRRRTLDMME